MPDPAADRLDQEPWDYERFIETYDRIAKARGGWRFEADGRTPEELRRRYLQYPEDAPTLEAFAEGLFRRSDPRGVRGRAFHLGPGAEPLMPSPSTIPRRPSCV
jgi:hypothetical protein